MGASTSSEIVSSPTKTTQWIDRVPPLIFLRVLLFVETFEERKVLFTLCKTTLAILEQESSWKWCCERLKHEKLMYVPQVDAFGDSSTWRERFLEMMTPSTTHKISVVARMRPQRVAQSADADATDDARVTVPISQRLQMIKRAKGCSSSEARKLLWGSLAREDPWSTSAIALKEEDPSDSNDKENQSDPAYISGTQAGMVSITEKTVILVAPSAGLREYTFDHVLKSSTSQKNTYEKGPSAIVTQFLNGINGTIFMFGQTGSGKTFTMFGPDTDSSSDICGTKVTRGVVPRAFNDVMDHCEFLRKHGVDCTLKLTYVEVLGNEVNNLIEDGASVGAWSGVAARTVLEGQASIEIKTKKEAEGWLKRGDENKRRAATAMNERSTRAHSVIMLDLVKKVNDTEQHSQLVLADLGGSEQLKKSKAVGEELSNAIKINVGLLALKQCIDAVNTNGFVPYHASTLTQLLSGALGGDSRTTIVVTCSMAPEHASESMAALTFGQKSMNIQNKSVMNMKQGTSAIDAIDARLKHLEEKIKTSERWENQVVIVKDIDGEEKKLVSVLVGAEEFREEYETLLARKFQLVGC
eukprot:m.136816 g.136816  ORF g.136816 m.136816 type:complete len:583 (+) comp29882_c1_seq1:146-1894(+)